ncbi:TIGR02391 family protein [Patescibacteria group bacterium]|nr:TIGR02391 family protein [Patescibacteria group bacterium]
MTKTLNDIFPPKEAIFEMEAEELAPFLLKYLKVMDEEGGSSQLNRYNFTLETNQTLRDYAGEELTKVAEILTEAWMWLEREGFLAPKPGEQGEWRFITRKGENVLLEEDFTAYSQGSLLPSENLHPILIRKVKPLFLRGDYDTAIFQAFKIVEVQVRKVGGYAKSDIGVLLMRKAFHPETGKLSNTHSEPSERQAMSDLFAGAIGLFKNPASHRFIDGISPEDAAGYIKIADCLLKMVEE